MTFEKLYLFFVILPHIGFAATILCIALGIATVISVICHVVNVSSQSYDKDAVKLLPYSRFYMCLTIPCLLLAILLAVCSPTKEELWMVAGGYAATNDAELKKLPDNVFRAANDYLEQLHQNTGGKKNDKNSSGNK